MLRFLALLIAVALAVNTGAAAAMALCQHHGPRAHVDALRSLDTAVASAAMAEEIAGRSASKAGTMADQVQVPVGAVVVPAAEPLALGPGRGPALFAARPVLEPPSRPIAPPERPPHA